MKTSRLLMLALLSLVPFSAGAKLVSADEPITPVVSTEQPASAPELPELEFNNFDLLIENETPRACFVFNEELDEAASVLTKYVDVTPKGDFSVRAIDGKLCVSGLAYGQTYTVGLRAGLPQKGYTPLAALVEQTVVVPDHAASLSFRSSGIVLAKNGDGGLPLRTINVESAHISILRVNDRNLINTVAEGMIGRSLYEYTAISLANGQGEKLYDGTLDIASKSNEWVATSIPVKTVLGNLKPGIYVTTAQAIKKDQDKDSDRDRWSEVATQWFVVTDIGLSVFKAEDGLSVVARSLAATTPMNKLTLTLYSRNNSVLGSAKTDASGLARFAPGLLRGEGGNAPRLLMASTDQKRDFAFIDLAPQKEIDLTDRGNTGRPASAPIEGYMVTERGIYRHGEEVHASLLLRNRDLTAPADFPLTVKIIRPDGVEAQVLNLKASQAGGFTFDYQTTTSSMSGTWSILAFADPAQPAISTATFLVDDFQPPRLEFDLKADAPFIPATGGATASIDARFLYGAPAGNLSGKADVTLSVAEKPFPQFSDYNFGLAEEDLLPKRIELGRFTTDEKGHATVDLALGKLPDTTHLLQANLTADIFDVGGRPVSRNTIIPLHNQPLNIGIRPQGKSVKSDTDTGFDIIALDADGNRIARDKLQWTLYEEHYEYYWWRFSDRWNYKPIVAGARVAGDTLSVSADKPTHITVPVGDGYYRLEVRDEDNMLVASSSRFIAGWWTSPDTVGKPDSVTVTYDPQKPVKAGDSVTVHVTAPYEAEATVVAATYSVNTPQFATLPPEGKDISVTVPKDASTGFYVLVSAVQKPGITAPAAAQGAPLRRAIGLVWVPLDLSAHRLDVSLDAPELVRPNQTIEVGVKVAGSKAESAYVTLAAVDDGVLQLTNYQSPNPDKWFYGQRLMGVSLFDVYGDLIDSSGALKGILHEGGDGQADISRQLKGLPEQTTKVVALFSGIVKVENGVAKVPLALPDFNGRLRLMVMAWDKNAVGQAEKQMTVRAPLVADLMLPRFLAPGDHASVQLSLDNRDAPSGTYHVELKSTGAAGFVSFEKQDVELAQGSRKALPLVLQGTAVGQARLDLKVTGPANFSLSRSFPISVRAGAQTITTRTVTTIAPGASLNNAPDLSAWVPGTVDMSLSLSPVPNIDVAYLIKDLMHYPYGCVEQTVSTALPSLYLSQVAASLNLGSDEESRKRVNYAINKLASMQNRDGGFGLWGMEDTYSFWLSVYVADFLTRAAEQHYVVPTSMRTSLLTRIAQDVKGGKAANNTVSMAYAFYILAKNQSVVVDDLRYFSDTSGDHISTRLGRAHLAAALKLVGDSARLTEAIAAIDVQPPEKSRSGDYDFGSDLRDQVASLTVMTEEGLIDLPRVLTEMEAIPSPERDWGFWHFYSTQEESWLLLLVHALLEKSGGQVHVKVGAKEFNQTTPLYRSFTGEPMPTVANLNDKPVYQMLTTSAVPLAPQPAASNGSFFVERRYFTPEGTEITDLSTVKQNDLVVVVLFGSSTEKYAQDIIISDMLPAAFEIENMRISKNDRTEGMAWLDELHPGTFSYGDPDEFSEPINTEFRSDRFVAAARLVCDWSCYTRVFSASYMMRAVTPGQFFQPGTYIEDMYRPTHFARTASGRVTIAPAQ